MKKLSSKYIVGSIFYLNYVINHNMILKEIPFDIRPYFFSRQALKLQHIGIPKVPLHFVLFNFLYVVLCFLLWHFSISYIFTFHCWKLFALSALSVIRHCASMSWGILKSQRLPLPTAIVTDGRNRHIRGSSNFQSFQRKILGWVGPSSAWFGILKALNKQDKQDYLYFISLM